MKRQVLLGVLLTLIPHQIQASVENIDGKEIAIIVLAIGSAFMSSGWLLWYCYTKVTKQNLEYDLENSQLELATTQVRLQAVESRLNEIAGQVGHVTGSNGENTVLDSLEDANRRLFDLPPAYEEQAPSYEV